MLVLFCQTCCIGLMTYGKWITHLLSPAHQKKSKNKIKDWSKKLQSRGVVFTEFCKPKEEIDQDVIAKLAWSVSEHTIISDLYFDCDKQVCVILIDEKKGADYIVSTDEIKANEREPLKRLVDDIPNEEWENVFKKSSENLQLKNLIGNNSEVDADVEILEVAKHAKPVFEIAIEDGDSDEDDFGNGDHYSESNIDFTQVTASCKSNAGNDNDSQTLEAVDNNDSVSTCNINLRNAKEVQNDDDDVQFSAFIEENMLSNEVIKGRRKVVRQLEKILKKSYKNIRLYPFENGLETLSFLKSSSVAVGVDINGDFYQPCRQAPIPIKEIKTLLCSAKKRETPLFFNVYENIFQRTSSITFIYNYKSVEIECDCFFSPTMEQQKWKFISACMDIDPRVLPLTQFLVIWYESYLQDFEHRQTSSNKLTVYYPFIQLIIYFLITNGIIPPIFCWQVKCYDFVKVNTFCEDKDEVLSRFKNLQSEYPDLQKFTYSDCDINPATGKPSAKCILELAGNFFQYFGEVNLENHLVSIPAAGLVTTTGKEKFFKISRQTPTPVFYTNRHISRTYLSPSYKRLAAINESMKNNLFIIQDAFDCDLLDSMQWSKTSVALFQSVCMRMAFQIKNILSRKSSLSDLLSIYRRDRDLKLTDDVSGSSPKLVVVDSTSFNFPEKSKRYFNSILSQKKLWFHVLKEFFDQIVKDVLKCQIKSTYVQNEELHNKIRECQLQQATNEENDVPIPSKRRKGKEGNNYFTISFKQCVDKSLRRMELPFRAMYFKSYSGESSFPTFSLDSRNEMRTKISRMPTLKDPMFVEKIISDTLIMNEGSDSIEMTYKISINCTELSAGMYLQTLCIDEDDRKGKSIMLREILSLVDSLAEKYFVYRVIQFIAQHKNENYRLLQTK